MGTAETCGHRGACRFGGPCRKPGEFFLKSAFQLGSHLQRDILTKCLYLRTGNGKWGEVFLKMKGYVRILIVRTEVVHRNMEVFLPFILLPANSILRDFSN